MRTLLSVFVVTLSACGGTGGSGAALPAAATPYYVGDWTTTNQDPCITTMIANPILFAFKADKSLTMFDQSTNLFSSQTATFDGEYIYLNSYAWQWEQIDDWHARLHFSPTCLSDYTKEGT